MSYRIFIVEDSPVMQEAYALVLDQEDDLTVCGIVESAEEALDQLADQPCDVVLADVSLPGMDGIELVKRLLEAQPELSALVVSGHDQAVLRDRALRAGACAYLDKQGLAHTLIPAIRQGVQPSSAPEASEAE